MPEVRAVVYIDTTGRSTFTRWFEELDSQAAARVTAALYRMGQGNFSNVEGVGSGVFEYRIDFGPGYRIYFGKDGETLVVLLGGSSKKRQQQAIRAARQSWKEYKRGKAHG
ncbi:MAG: type II toxin-antitoxin system RelE/ParE family toxin [Betaproteobacteria bacterium]|nr:type II toxin-antitoxin system RelE/ParE family toxin [Betaproteobacteria bacterium]